jgi:hypothetical protein
MLGKERRLPRRTCRRVNLHDLVGIVAGRSEFRFGCSTVIRIIIRLIAVAVSHVASGSLWRDAPLRLWL